MSENKTSLLQIRVKEHTLEQIDRLKNIVNSPSRSDAIRRFVDISERLINESLKGGSIILEDKKGNQKKILINGINS